LPEACPIYDPTGISFAAQEAINKFQGPWLAARVGNVLRAGHYVVRDKEVASSNLVTSILMQESPSMTTSKGFLRFGAH
jgi:hypothetical protein